MDKITKFKKILQQELEYQASIPYANAPNLKAHLIINKEETVFLLLRSGWFQKEFKYGVVFHFEIKNNKVWLYQNSTDIDIGRKLEEKGISKKEIVLAFVSTLERTTEGYAVA